MSIIGGKQYRYIKFVCSKVEKKRLLRECLIDLSLPNPKDKDLSWTKFNTDTGIWEETTKPPYVTDDLDDYKPLRICTACGKEMIQGYVIADGEEYYCSDECLNYYYSEEEYLKLCEQDLAYWTQWE